MDIDQELLADVTFRAMPVFVKCLEGGHSGPNLTFWMLGDDNKKYQLTITPECFMQLFSIAWQAAKDLPPAPDSGVTVDLQTQAQAGLFNMQPALLLGSGPLVLALTLGPEQMAVLQDAMKMGADLDKGPKH